jgi:hypothetical protein
MKDYKKYWFDRLGIPIAQVMQGDFVFAEEWDIKDIPYIDHTAGINETDNTILVIDKIELDNIHINENGTGTISGRITESHIDELDKEEAMAEKLTKQTMEHLEKQQEYKDIKHYKHKNKRNKIKKKWEYFEWRHGCGLMFLKEDSFKTEESQCYSFEMTRWPVKNNWEFVWEIKRAL